MQDLTDNNFTESLQHGKILLMFYTDWCPMCPSVTDMLYDLERKEDGAFLFSRINHDDNPKAAEAFGVLGVPTVLAILDGAPLYGCAGILMPDVYRMMAEELLYSFDEKLLSEKIDRIDAFIDAWILAADGNEISM